MTEGSPRPPRRAAAAGRARGPTKHVVAKYVFVDIVGFSLKTVQGQRQAIATLNRIVREAVAHEGVRDRSRLLLPTGDGVCVALLNVTTPSIHVRIAMEILRRLDEHSAQAGSNAFQLRVGVNSGTDHLIDDINGRPNVAGTAINLAQRIMSSADPNQIMAGRPVYDDLAGDEDYADWFREHDAVVKHDQRHTIYQIVAHDLAFLNVQPPSRIGLSALHDAFEKVKSEEFLRALTVRQLAELDSAVLRAHVVSAAKGDAESYVHAFERARALPPVWRKGYALDVEMERLDGSPTLRRTRLDWQWSYVNHSGEDIADFEQQFVHVSRNLPADLGDGEWIHLAGVELDRRSVIDDVSHRVRRNGHERIFEGSMKLALPAGPTARARKLRYAWEVTERYTEPLVASVMTPVHGVEVSLRCPRDVVPRLYVMGMPDNDEQTDPLPYTEETPATQDRPGRFHWTFDGWLLQNQGFLLVLAAPES